MEPHRFSIEIGAPPEGVWRALTDPVLFSQWYGATVRIDARSGGAATFRFEDGIERTGVVEIIEPPRLLLFRWHPFQRDAGGRTVHAPAGYLRFILRPAGDATLLEIEDSVGDRSSDVDLRAVMG